MTMNEELRLKFTPASKAILENHKAELTHRSGSKISWSHAINDCLNQFVELTQKHNSLVQEYEDFMRRWNAAGMPLECRSSAALAPLLPLPRVRETLDLLNIKEKKYIKKETPMPKPTSRGKHLLPKDFSPPRSIAKEAGVDYDGGLECFADWANSQGKKYTDWTACFRNACRSWLKEKFPHLRRAPIKSHGDSQILRNEDMNDTRPPLA